MTPTRRLLTQLACVFLVPTAIIRHPPVRDDILQSKLPASTPHYRPAATEDVVDELGPAAAAEAAADPPAPTCQNVGPMPHQHG